MFGFLKRTTLSERQEAAVKKKLHSLKAQRKSRFRILACIDGLDESYRTVRWAARLAQSSDCDIIILYVRAIDQGLHSGGLQVRLARQNMMDAGFELPGVSYLKRALAVLKEEGLDAESWDHESTNQRAWGDAAGDTKAEYREPNGRTVVLKLKVAPDIANGILDQYELGPYNLIIVGDAAKWKTEFQSFFGAGIAQKVASLAPCSVLLARDSLEKKGYLIHTDGSARSLQAVRRASVLAHVTKEPVSLLATAENTAEAKAAAQVALDNALALLKAMKIDVAETRLATGETVEEIVEIGALYKVVAVKDEGHGRIQRLFKGSAASEVIKRSRTSVLEIR